MRNRPLVDRLVGLLAVAFVAVGVTTGAVLPRSESVRAVYVHVDGARESAEFKRHFDDLDGLGFALTPGQVTGQSNWDPGRDGSYRALVIVGAIVAAAAATVVRLRWLPIPVEVTLLTLLAVGVTQSIVADYAYEHLTLVGATLLLVLAYRHEVRADKSARPPSLTRDA